MTDAFISFEHTGYTFDTNVIIYYLKGDTDAVSKVEEVLDTAPVYVSTMTELELFSSPHSSFEHLQLIESLLAVISIIPVESRVARLAGSLREKRLSNHPMLRSRQQHSSQEQRCLQETSKILGM